MKIHGATLNGTVNPNGLDTTVKFLYDIDETLSNPVEVNLPEVLTGRDVIPVAVPITDLVAETTYFFKVSATNSDGTSEGVVLNFLTLADTVEAGGPTVETLPATNIV